MITCLLFGDCEGYKPSTLHRFLNYIVQVSVSANLVCNRDHLLHIHRYLSVLSTGIWKRAPDDVLFFQSWVCVWRTVSLIASLISLFCRHKHTKLPLTTTHSSSREDLVAGSDRPLHRSILSSSISMAFISFLPSTCHLLPLQETCGQPSSWTLHPLPALPYLLLHPQLSHASHRLTQESLICAVTYGADSDHVQLSSHLNTQSSALVLPVFQGLSEVFSTSVSQWFPTRLFATFILIHINEDSALSSVWSSGFIPFSLILFQLPLVD